MKRLLCCLLALMMLIPVCLAEEPFDSARVTFEDGFSLSLPADWVSYAVDPALAELGYIYCLGSVDGERLMYIQRWAAGVTDIEALSAHLESRDEIELRSDANGDFLMYSFVGADCSGCATVLDGSVLNLLFLPQSDSENMLIAATVLESFSAE